MDTETFTLVRCTQETAKAIFVRLSDGHGVWVPKAVVHPDSDVRGINDIGDLVVDRWFAEKEGL